MKLALARARQTTRRWPGARQTQLLPLTYVQEGQRCRLAGLDFLRNAPAASRACSACSVNLTCSSALSGGVVRVNSLWRNIVRVRSASEVGCVGSSKGACRAAWRGGERVRRGKQREGEERKGRWSAGGGRGGRFCMPTNRTRQLPEFLSLSKSQAPPLRRSLTFDSRDDLSCRLVSAWTCCSSAEKGKLKMTWSSRLVEGVRMGAWQS